MWQRILVMIIIYLPKNILSIKIIKENKKEIPKLIFHEIENDFVSMQINQAKLKKKSNRT